VGNANFVFTRNTETSQHAVIELSVPLSFFGTNTLQNVSWAPSCDNSYLSISVHPIPEPGSLMLMLMGAVGACCVARSRILGKAANSHIGHDCQRDL
jgi:hypothetical protein